MRTQLLPRTLMTALHRFGATRSIQDVSVAARGVCEVERDRLDSELGMVRFVAWAIPAIGFVGTVRGIGQALQQAHKAVEGDVSGVVAGSAFRSMPRSWRCRSASSSCWCCTRCNCAGNGSGSTSRNTWTRTSFAISRSGDTRSEPGPGSHDSARPRAQRRRLILAGVRRRRRADRGERRLRRAPGPNVLSVEAAWAASADRAAARAEPVLDGCTVQVGRCLSRPAACRQSADLAHAHLTAVLAPLGAGRRAGGADRRAPGVLARTTRAAGRRCQRMRGDLLAWTGRNLGLAACATVPPAFHTHAASRPAAPPGGRPDAGRSLATRRRAASCALLVNCCPGTGVLAFEQALIATIATNFVRRDPLSTRCNEAAIEQRLYDRLARVARGTGRAPRGGRGRIREAGGMTHQVTLQRTQLVNAGRAAERRGALGAWCQARADRGRPGLCCCIGSCVPRRRVQRRRVPGLLERLSTLRDCMLVTLEPTAGARWAPGCRRRPRSCAHQRVGSRWYTACRCIGAARRRRSSPRPVVAEAVPPEAVPSPRTCSAQVAHGRSPPCR